MGCPGGRDGEAAKAVTTIPGMGEVDGVALISVPMDRGSEGAPVASAGNKNEDALVPGTNFNATGTVPCARSAGQPTSQCRFGVVRNAGWTVP